MSNIFDNEEAKKDSDIIWLPCIFEMTDVLKHSIFSYTLTMKIALIFVTLNTICIAKYWTTLYMPLDHGLVSVYTVGPFKLKSSPIWIITIVLSTQLLQNWPILQTLQSYYYNNKVQQTLVSLQNSKIYN